MLHLELQILQEAMKQKDVQMLNRVLKKEVLISMKNIPKNTNTAENAYATEYVGKQAGMRPSGPGVDHP